MTTTDRDFIPNDRQGEAVYRAYAGFALTPEQRHKHRMRLAGAARRRGADRFRFHAAEIGAIAAIALLAILAVFAWQSLDRGSDGAGVADGPTITADDETSAIATLQPTPPDAPEGTPGGTPQPEVEYGYVDGRCVTTPYELEGPPDAGQAAFTDTWLGGDPDGLWAGLGPENKGVWSDGGLRVLWWRQDPQTISVTGQRLDGDAPPLEVDLLAGYEGMSHQISALNFPTPGCWEVTGTAGEEMRLRFVIEVVPYVESPPGMAVQQRKDDITAEREEAMPFLPPDTCTAGEWTGPENRLGGSYPNDVVESENWTYSYFLDGSGISLNSRLGLFFEGENPVFWLSRSYRPQDTTYSAERLDGDSEPASISFGDRATVAGVNSDENLTVQAATINFPTPGCWLITVESQDTGFRQTVYVYPAEERPDAAASVQGQERLYTVDADGHIRGFDLVSGARFLTIDSEDDTDIALSPDGATLYAVSGDSLAAFDAVTGEEQWRVSTGYRRVAYMGGGLPVIATSGDGNLVYVYGTDPPDSLDYMLTAHDAANGEPVWSAPVPTVVEERGGTEAVHIFCAPSIWPSHSGSRVLAMCMSGGNVSASGDSHLLDMESGEVIKTDNLPETRGRTVATAGSADGSRIYALSSDGHLAVYDRESLEIIDSLELITDATPVNDGLAVSPDGSRLYVAASTTDSLAYFTEVRVFDAATWAEVERIELGFESFGRALAVDSTGNLYGIEWLSGDDSRVWKRDAASGAAGIVLVADTEVQQLLVAGSQE